MKRNLLLSVLLPGALLIVLTGCFGPKQSGSSKERNRKEAKHHHHKKNHGAKSERDGEDEDENEMYDGILAAQQREYDMTHDPTTNTVPKDRLVNALAQRNKSIALQKMGSNISTLGIIRPYGGTAAINAINWVERGSYTDATGPSNGNTRPNNGITSGRMAAIWNDADPGFPNQVFAGGIDGGLWSCTDITARPATWNPIDNFANLAISSICQDPSHYNIMYFGTGEKTFNVDAVRGGGVWKSTDHGATWNQLSGTTGFWNVSKVLCDNSGNVYVATIGSGAGLQRSADGGSTWTKITPTVSGINTTRVSDMAYDPSSDRMHVYMGYLPTAGSGIIGYCYGTPSSVTQSSWSVPSTGSGMAIGTAAATSTTTTYEQMVQLAVKSGVVWALRGNYANMVLYRSTDGGVTWAARNTMTNANDIYGIAQDWYSIAVDCDPSNPGNNVIFGGLNMFKSTNGGTAITQVSEWVTGANTGSPAQYVHADVHNVSYVSSTRVLVGSDGGFFYSADGGGTWTDRNTNLRLKQFYSCATNQSFPDYFLAGAQDNGCHQFTQPGLGSSVEVTGGDGAIVAIDQINPANQIGSYVYNQYRVSTNGGATWTQRNINTTAGQFINPFDFDSRTKMLYAAYTAGNYLRWNNPAINATPSTSTLSVSSVIGSNIATAITASPNLANTIYIAGNNSDPSAPPVMTGLAKVVNANTSTPAITNITPPALASTGLTISSIVVGPGTSDQDLIVTCSNYNAAGQKVFISSNGGTTWTDITGNGSLPDMPVRWALFYPGSNTQAFLATEAGVWYTPAINGASTNWQPSVGFPAVRCDMIKYNSAYNTIAVGTHGRGLWTSKLSTAPTISFYYTPLITAKSNGTTTSGCRTYLDYTDTLLISDAPSGTATATLSVQPGGTAIQGADFDFTTNGNFTTPSSIATFTNAIFPVKVPITIRVYNNHNKNATLPQTANLVYSISGPTNAVTGPMNQALALNLSDVLPNPTTIETVLSSTVSNYETSNQSIDYMSSSTKIIASISSPSADLACVTASIDSAGSTWRSYQNGSRSQKVFLITPTTNGGSTTNYSATLYFTTAELNGKTASSLRIAKTSASTVSASDGTNTVLVTPGSFTAFGSGYAFTGAFSGFSRFFLVDNNVLLPITLLDFKATLINHNSELQWITSSETNNHQFDVELSRDGVNFVKLGTLLSKGNSTTNVTYNYTHVRPETGINYYRLKQIDNDGRFTYTKIIAINVDGNGSPEMVLYPVPAKQSVTLNFGTIVQQAEISIYSNDMKLLQKETVSQASYTKDIDISRLPAGVYILRITSADKTKTLRFVKE